MKKYLFSLLVGLYRLLHSSVFASFFAWLLGACKRKCKVLQDKGHGPAEKQGAAAPDPRLELVYTDGKGHAWYRYRDLMHMPMRRLLAVQAASRMLDMALDRDTLARMLNQMVQYGNQGRLVDLMASLHELKTRSELLVDESCLLQLAACYFVRNDENPDTYDADLAAQKIQAWQKCPKDLDFFLTAPLTCIDSSSEVSPHAILDYLAQTPKPQPPISWAA